MSENNTKPLTKTETLNLLAERTGMNRKQVTSLLDELGRLIAEQLNEQGPGSINVPGLMRIKVLRKPAQEITLKDVVEATDGLADFERCPAGLAKCDDQQPCGMHERWKPLRGNIMEYLEHTSIADLASSLEKKRAALEKPRRGRRPAAKKS